MKWGLTNPLGMIYLTGCSKEEPVAHHIIRNAARCKKCGTEIESRHRHDWVSCKCGAIFVDGGHDYLRRGGDPADHEDLTEVQEEQLENPSSTEGSPS